MDPEYTKVCVSHVRHCMAYKKVIMEKVIDTFQLPNVIERYLFTYVGFFPIAVNFKLHRPLMLYKELEE